MNAGAKRPHESGAIGTEEQPAKKRAAGDGAVSVPADETSSRCPYLAQVDRKALDFEMQRRCSVSMSTERVHMCLVCGKYFRGREAGSPAYYHALEHEHYVYLSFDDAAVWCLPDGYQVHDSSLDDILGALRPHFSGSAIERLDSNNVLSTTTDGKDFLPGYVGLDNAGSADYISVAIQCLSHVRPFRDFFLRKSNHAGCTSHLVQGLGDTIRRLWSPGLFKPSVSPHDFVVQIQTDSRGRFRPGQYGESMEFLGWLLQRVHHDLLHEYSSAEDAKERAKRAEAAARSRLQAKTGVGISEARSDSDPGAAARASRQREGRWWLAGGTAPGRTIVTECFYGAIEVQEVVGGRSKTGDEMHAAQRAGPEAARLSDGRPLPAGISPLIAHEVSLTAGSYDVVCKTKPFFFLSTELPPVPVFVEEEEDGRAQVVPEVVLHEILTRFGGSEVVESLEGGVRRRSVYKTLQLPPFLMLHVKRFSHNAFFAEKNPTRVALPLRNLLLDGPMKLQDGKPPARASVCAKAAATRGAYSASSAASSKAASSSSSSGAASDVGAGAGAGAGAYSSLGKAEVLAIKLLQAAHPALHARLSREWPVQKLARAAARLNPASAKRALQLRIALRYRTKLDLECSVVHDSPPEMAKGSTAAAQAAAARLATHHSTVERAAESAAQQALRAEGAGSAGRSGSSSGAGADRLGHSTNSAYEATESALQALRAGTYRVQVRHKASDSWYELRDVKVARVDPEQITPGEAYALLYVKQGAHELRSIEAAVERLLLQD